MYEQFKDRADFLTIYIREAHPEDEWQMESNLTEEVCYLQPRSQEDRVRIASDFARRFHYPIPLAIDTMADTANRVYAGWPERLFIIGEDGRILYQGGMGPFNYKPEEVRAWLVQKFPTAAAPGGAS